MYEYFFDAFDFEIPHQIIVILKFTDLTWNQGSKLSWKTVKLLFLACFYFEIPHQIALKLSGGGLLGMSTQNQAVFVGCES